MNEIGKFNKEHDRALQKITQIGTGPTENQLTQIQKQAAEFQQQRKALESQFIKSQAKAVDQEILISDQQEKLIELKRKVAILDQKRRRLVGAQETNQKQIQEQMNIQKNYENEMKKLNDALARLRGKSVELSGQ